MTPFLTCKARAVPLRRDDVDTDQLIPARYLTTVSREGLGKGLFSAWRQDRDFVLNRPCFQSGRILLAGDNFGSGSSREHAVWALTDYGFRAVIAAGFADIFYNNSLKNGLLPVPLAAALVEELQTLVEGAPETELEIDLPQQILSWPGGSASFPIDPYRKTCLIQGLDDLGYLLSLKEQIETFERCG